NTPMKGTIEELGNQNYINSNENENGNWTLTQALNFKDPELEKATVTWTPNPLPHAPRIGKTEKGKKPWSNFFQNLGLIFPKKQKDEKEVWNPYPSDGILPSRLEEDIETAIYSMSHVKLAQTGRPLLEQVQISNFMMYILSVHSSVTIRGRGPQRRRHKKKR